MERGIWKMEKKGNIEIEKGVYVFKKKFAKKCTKDILLKHEGIFYSCKVENDRLVCSDRTITGKVQIWF